MATLRFPERLLQPFRSLRQFQQELYAMHKEDRPRPAPVAATEHDGEGRLASKGSRSNASVAGRSREDARNSGLDLSANRQAGFRDAGSSPPAFQAAVRKPRPEGVTRERTETKVVAERRREASHTPTLLPARNRPAPAERKDPAESRRTPRPEPERQRKDRPEAKDDARKPSGQTPVPESKGQEPDPRNKDVVDYQQRDLATSRLPFVPGGSGGTTTFLGKVKSGKGDTYQVTLYPNGPKGAAGEVVEVTIPFIDPDDQIPGGTWINPIFQFPRPAGTFGPTQIESVYSCQVPVWMP